MLILSARSCTKTQPAAAGAGPTFFFACVMRDSNFSRAFFHVASDIGKWPQPPLPLQSLNPFVPPQPPWFLQSFWPEHSWVTVKQFPWPAQVFLWSLPCSLHSLRPRHA